MPTPPVPRLHTLALTLQDDLKKGATDRLDDDELTSDQITVSSRPGSGPGGDPRSPGLL